MPKWVAKGVLQKYFVERHEATARTHDVMGTGAFVPGVVIVIGTTPEGQSVKGRAYRGANDFVGTSTTPGEVGNIYGTCLFGLFTQLTKFLWRAQGLS